MSGESTGIAKIDEYLAIPFTEGSGAFDDLMANVDDEARHRSIRLTGDGDAGTASGNLTPAMNTWFNMRVAQPRQAALKEIEALGAAIQIGQANRGKVVEIEQDRLRREHAQRNAEIHSQFSKENGERIATLDRLNLEYDQLRVEEGERDPKTPAKWIDIAIPIGILIPESLLNFESFMASPLIHTGIMALGVTIIVGIAIGFSAFLSGRFWKAFNYWMRPYDERQKAKGFRMIGIATTLLLMALGVVAAARYYYLLPMIEEAQVLGLTPPNVVWSTSSLLLGNIVVFILGAAITYWIHDENPEYADKAEKLHRAKADMERVRRTRLIGPLKESDRRHRQDSEKLRASAKLIETRDGYSQIRDALALLAGKDSEIVGVMQTYRQRLVGRMLDLFDPDERLFSAQESLNAAMTNRSALTAADFANLPIGLYKC